MKPVHTGGFRLAYAFLGLVITGCDSNSSGVDTLPRVAVHGTITLDGKPLPEGKLQFQPDPSGTGIVTVAEIQEGRFSLDRSNGPTPGKYHVIVSSIPVYKIKPGDEPGGGPPKSGPETIPKWYMGASSELTAEVEDDSPQSFDFALSSKRP